ncbi:MAG TPA: IS630 family transposase [Candidatus Kerfeldbacteria bacterium]|nr:IS630 family transposase [Candidatus Kerfeldbacteria bacterium]
MRTYQKLKQNQHKELNQVISNTHASSVEVRRAQAILLLDNGSDPTHVTGYSRRQCFDIRKRYVQHGLLAIADQRKNNLKPLLTKRQREAIIHTLKTKQPKDIGYTADYWTTAVLGYYIEQTYQVKYKSRTSHYLLFKKAEFTFHKPGQVYQKHNEQEVREWETVNRNKLKRALKDKHTVLLCEDEMVLSSKTTFQKIWLPKGAYPQIIVSNKKAARSVYGFLNLKTGTEHAFKTEWQNMFITAEVLGRLRQIYPTEKIVLLWDGPGWHKGSKVQEFFKHDGNIAVIHFPRYSPEQNPQEHVWKAGRQAVTHNQYIADIDTTTDAFVQYLNTTKFNYSLPVLSAE